MIHDPHIHKVVAVLPSTLTADALYAVRAGEGFDLYLADSTGAIAHKVNGSDRHVTLTQAAYDALATKDPATYYHISG